MQVTTSPAPGAPTLRTPHPTSSEFLKVMAGLLVLVLFYLGVGTAWRDYSGSQKARLLGEGQRLVQELETFRKRNGRYPNSLEEAALTPDPTLVRYWFYRHYVPPNESISLGVENWWSYWLYDGSEGLWEQADDGS